MFSSPGQALWPGIRHPLNFLLNPAIQEILLEAPTISQLECRNFVVVQIFIKSVWRDSEILRCLPQRHHFLLLFHVSGLISPRVGGITTWGHGVVTFFFGVFTLAFVLFYRSVAGFLVGQPYNGGYHTQHQCTRGTCYVHPKR